MDECISGQQIDETLGEMQNSSVHQTVTGTTILDTIQIKSQSIQEWIEALLDGCDASALENQTSTEVNEFENSDLVKFLVNALQSLVLWSGINAHYFNSPIEASTSNVECYFKNVKQQVDVKLPCRVDQFICAHIQMMEGINRQVSLGLIKFVDGEGGLQNILGNQNQLDDCDNELLEQWKNLSGNSAQLEIDDGNSTTEFIDHQEDDQQGNNAQFTEINEESIDQSPNLPIANEQFPVDDVNSTVNEPMIKCFACQRGDAPTGAHTCYKCGKFVHLFDGCSYSCGDEEGYGEKRICISCKTGSVGSINNRSTRSTKSTGSTNHQTTKKQLNETEKWSKRKRSNNSYLQPVPNWNLDQRVQSRPKISILSNASKLALTHMVEGKRVALRNTSAFDSISQVIFFS